MQTLVSLSQAASSERRERSSRSLSMSVGLLRQAANCVDGRMSVGLLRQAADCVDGRDTTFLNLHSQNSQDGVSSAKHTVARVAQSRIITYSRIVISNPILE